MGQLRHLLTPVQNRLFPDSSLPAARPLAAAAVQYIRCRPKVGRSPSLYVTSSATVLDVSLSPARFACGQTNRLTTLHITPDGVVLFVRSLVACKGSCRLQQSGYTGICSSGYGERLQMQRTYSLLTLSYCLQSHYPESFCNLPGPAHPSPIDCGLQ